MTVTKKEKFKTDNFNLDIHPEVEAALHTGGPVVALESTIISHGMPFPGNVQTALELEKIIRAKGAVPATCAIIKGRYKVGLDPDDIEYLGTAEGIKKASRRDLPAITALKLSAATTVASTMILANMAGISIFATGGIGGVHRGAEKTFDISADLIELSKTPVAVVTAGAKAILDLHLTMEYLETLGVPVLGYGTDELPAFYTRESGINLEYSVKNPREAALVLIHKWAADLKGGVVIANPIPEVYALEKNFIDNAIDKTLAEAEKQGIKGKKLTPFLLANLAKITEGSSLSSNIELVKNNAAVAAEIARELSDLEASEAFHNPVDSCSVHFH